jgi:hypothetical protein
MNDHPDEPARRAIMPRSSSIAAVGAAAAVSLICFAIGGPHHGAGVAFIQAQAQQSKPAAAPTTVTEAGVTLRSVSVEFPDRGQMFPGKDADAINSNCLACHSAGMVLQQPALSPATWQAEVDKMRSQYKAPVDPSAVPAIVAYLTAHKGAQ